ncbi:MAG TPA: hypothetical protein PLA97_13915, partial [Rubrivivax sp.]|nr:hypothetical protein [Rubrivivax sp.]
QVMMGQLRAFGYPLNVDQWDGYPAARRRLIGVLQACTQTRVLATHDLDLVLDTCQRVVVLHQGRLRADGAPESVLADTDLLAECGLEPPLSASLRAWPR